MTTEFRASSEPLPPIPADVSIPQFILDSPQTARLRESGTPLLVDDSTGRALKLDEVRSRTDALANGLKDKYAIREDDVVLIFSRNNIDYAANELQYQLEISKAVLMFAHPDALAVALEAATACGLPAGRVVLFGNASPSESLTSIDDLVQLGAEQRRFIEPKIDGKTKLAFLSFSSGTTGKPKASMLIISLQAVSIPHIAPITNVIQMAVHNRVHDESIPWDERRYRSGDIAMCGAFRKPLRLHRSSSLSSRWFQFCRYTMSVVVVPKFNFVQMLKSIVHYRITHLMLVPPQVVLLCKHPAVKDFKQDLQVVRCIMVGAAPLSAEVNHRLFQLLPDAEIGQSYGMTETCTATSSWPITQRRGTSGSAGQLLPGIIARVVKPDGTLAGYDEAGELVVYSPSNALRYENNAEASRETFVGGWVRTGDEVKIDRNAEIWILDRIKEIMKVRGFQVAPAELEGCILDHRDVLDACVVGIPDDYSGEVPLAFVVLNSEAEAKVKGKPQEARKVKESISKHVAANKVAYKHLKGGVEFVPVIPKNPSGKLLRRVLRDQAKLLLGTRPAKL
ncbi:phenylacetyl-CoA ligase [Hymenopellis radicata]|nr:phenylacetyl-CoA ligase [Hymenopellis radicata]